MTYSAWQYILSFTLYYKLAVLKILYHFVFKYKYYNYFPVFRDLCKDFAYFTPKIVKAS